MGVGDLITTPNWSWHDHYNGGDEPAVWLDGMDARMIMALSKPINEPFPTLHQPVERPAGTCSARSATCGPPGRRMTASSRPRSTTRGTKPGRRWTR